MAQRAGSSSRFLSFLVLLATGFGKAPPTQTLFEAGAEGIRCYRIPILLSLGATGPLLAFAEAREYSCGDIGSKRVACRCSLDGGHSWSGLSFIYDDSLPKTAAMGLNLGMATYDATTTEVFLHFGECVHLQGCNATAVQLRSRDLGLTWEPEVLPGIVQGEVSAFKFGEGTGIQLQSGRLLVCGRYNSPTCGPSTKKGDANCGSRCMFSDDHGTTWRLAPGDVKAIPGEVSPSECQAVELRNGSILLNMRDETGSHVRLLARSDDEGETWQPLWREPDLIDAKCQGSMIGPVDGNLYFSNAFATGRRNLTISKSDNGGASWKPLAVMTNGSAAYSALSYVEVHPSANAAAAPRCLAFAYEVDHGIRVGRCCGVCGFDEGLAV